MPVLVPPLPAPARAGIAALLALLALLPVTRPAAAQAPTQDLAPPAVLARPVAKPPAHPSVMPVKPPSRLALAPAPAPVHTLAPAPMRAAPPAPTVFPDRGRQLIELQTASRVGPPPRRLNPTEAALIWKGYTARIGKPPALTGGGSGGGGGGSP